MKYVLNAMALRVVLLSNRINPNKISMHAYIFVLVSVKDHYVTINTIHREFLVFEPTCAHARWALRYRLLSVCLSVCPSVCLSVRPGKY